VPSSKPMIHAVSEAGMLSSPKGLLGYHQVSVVEPHSMILVHDNIGPHTHRLQSLDGRIDNLPVNDQDLKHYF